MDGLPPYSEYQVKVEAHNAYGAAPPLEVVPSYFSGADSRYQREKQLGKDMFGGEA